ncbi:MAG: hypothetical protein ABEH78_07900 [Haloferacaceae archaeon]
MRDTAAVLALVALAAVVWAKDNRNERVRRPGLVVIGDDLDEDDIGNA